MCASTDPHNRLKTNILIDGANIRGKREACGPPISDASRCSSTPLLRSQESRNDWKHALQETLFFANRRFTPCPSMETLGKSCDQWAHDARQIVQPRIQTTTGVVPPGTTGSAVKARRFGLSAVVLVLLTLSVIIVVFVPWLPVTANHKIVTVRQEVVLRIENVTLMPWISWEQETHYWLSGDFHLSEGEKARVTLRTDSKMVSIYVIDGVGWTGTSYYIAANEEGWFIAPKSGNFHIIIDNTDVWYEHSVSADLTVERTEVKCEQHVTRVSIMDLLAHRIEFCEC
jgi:hypothetical protein